VREPRFEVVVAAYGRSPYLRETLESVISNVGPAVRVTVIDDCSPDDSVVRIAEGLSPRVGYRRNEQNLGTSGAFNEAMRISQAQYVVLVGPDDLLLPGGGDAYERAIALGTDAGAIHPGVQVIDESGAAARPLPDRVKDVLRPAAGLHKGEELAVRLLLGNWTYNPAIAWRTDLVASVPFDESLRTAMDLDRLLRMAAAGEALFLSDDAALAYRRHAGAVSSVNRGLQRLSEELDCHARACVEFRELGWSRAIVAAQAAPTARAHGFHAALTADSSTLRERWATVRAALTPLRG
jgi:glycosyltransferase involved in cell wall biosynthesis